ncbi:MAG: hypothetical protein R3C41_05100 [Calditrichia bacterium]
MRHKSSAFGLKSGREIIDFHDIFHDNVPVSQHVAHLLVDVKHEFSENILSQQAEAFILEP